MSQRSELKNSFKDYFQNFIGVGEFEKFLKFLNEGQTRRTVRVNTLKISKEALREWLESQGYEAVDNPFSMDGIDVIGSGKPLALKLPYLSGFTYPQDSSSMFAVELLNPKPGERIIDLTAAPGGKTTHIAQRMKNTGVLIANDMDTSRIKALHSNLERLGIWNTAVIRMMPHKIAEMYPETFDKVLLDPSCSGEGLLAKGGKANFWSPKAVKLYASEQFGILKSAFMLLKPGGVLVYSTCTLNEFEDDGVVNRLLEEFENAEIADASHVAEFAPRQFKTTIDCKGFRFWPQITGTKGFFCVGIRKSGNLMTSKESPHKISTQRHTVPIMTAWSHIAGRSTEETFNKTEKYFKRFGCEIPDSEFVLKENYLFCLSRELMEFQLPASCSLSFPILKIFGEDIKPTHEGSILMGLSAKKNVFEMSSEDLENFIERRPIENRGGLPDGAYLARFGIFPLGFAKIQNGKITLPFPSQY